MSREDETTLLVDERLTDGDPRGLDPVDLVPHWLRGSALAWASPLAIAGYGADGALGQERGLQALRKGRKSLLRIGFTGKGRAAQFLESFDFLLTVLEQLLVDRALRLRLAGLRVDQNPALLHPAA